MAFSDEEKKLERHEPYPQNKNAAALKGSGNLWLVLAVALIAGLLSYFYFADSGGSAAKAQDQPRVPQFVPPTVVLHRVDNADLATGSDYIGRVESIQAVSLRPQVAGEVARVHFREGSFVKEGDLLFTLDDKQYRAAADLRKADLARAEANLLRASKYFERLKAADRRSISAADRSSLTERKSIIARRLT